jgi:hypothetical protein
MMMGMGLFARGAAWALVASPDEREILQPSRLYKRLFAEREATFCLTDQVCNSQPHGIPPRRISVVDKEKVIRVG